MNMQNWSSLPTRSQQQPAEEDGLVYFTYEKSNNGKDYKYYATVFKGTDAYWLIQFACEVDDFDKFLPDFQKMGKIGEIQLSKIFSGNLRMLLT